MKTNRRPPGRLFLFSIFFGLGLGLGLRPTLALAQTPAPTGLGAVLWDGQYTPAPAGQDMPQGLAVIASHGFQSVKIPITPSDLVTSFGVQGLSTGPANQFLQRAVAAPAVAAALANPSIQNYVLTSYDAIVEGIDGSQRNFMNLAFLQANESDIVASYQGMALALYRAYKGTGKTFMIDNWETDNSVYCDSAAGFATDPSFQASCLSTYRATYGAANPAAAFTALQTWFHYRTQGIRAATAQAIAEGDTGVTVLSGVEIVAVHLLHDLPTPYPTTLYNLIPALIQAGDIQAVGYSAYESINQGTLLTDMPIIEQQLQGLPLMITEFGFFEGLSLPINGTTYTADQLMTDTVQQIVTLYRQGRLKFALAWEAFQDGAAQEFGLFDGQGNPTDLYTALVAGLTPPALPVLQIGSAYVDGPYGTSSYITLMGSFSGPGAGLAGGDVVTLNCGSGPIPNTNSYDSTTQINIMFPSVPSARTCSVQVTSNGQLSATAGGLAVAAGVPAPSLSLVAYDGIYAGNAYITAYGAGFIGQGDIVNLRCGSSGALVANTLSYDSTGQINILFKPLGAKTNCTVQVNARGQNSNTMGVAVPAGTG